jgi:hypothetical protein
MRLSADVTGIPADILVRTADADEPRLWLKPRPGLAEGGRRERLDRYRSVDGRGSDGCASLG